VAGRRMSQRVVGRGLCSVVTQTALLARPEFDNAVNGLNMYGFGFDLLEVVGCQSQPQPVRSLLRQHGIPYTSRQAG